MSNAELHTLTGAYALHALSDTERVDFERHLGDCAACAVEVRELSETATRLGLAVAETSPRGLRDRVLREITTVRQESPSGAGRDRSGGTAARGDSTTGRGAGSTGLGGWWPRYALAACLAAAVGFGGIAVWQYRAAQDARQEARASQQWNERMAQVLAAPDAKASSGTMKDGTKGTVVVSQSENRAVFMTSGMRQPPSGKVYQLWFDDHGTMRSAGLMNTRAASDAVLLDGPVDGASGIGITMEPAGGSAQPTSAPLTLMNFPAA
ncbi:anti-sigma factor domain-containing protein [Streptomyces sp. Ncost-T10-10d]|uniref:anti-sigma factor n=1 Tax=Streptomyces sp. Ncost-T10-10d TaxID=1839774 RepID=UPI00081D7660|nr:anti-sigma factor [Streptomyces sp. Ncost-T10-10d]SCF85308.1 Putative zinc-finger [Streptomyces sp. Ncost-T10-10d]